MAFPVTLSTNFAFMHVVQPKSGGLSSQIYEWGDRPHYLDAYAHTHTHSECHRLSAILWLCDSLYKITSDIDKNSAAVS